MTASPIDALVSQIREVADLTVGPLRDRFEAVVGRPARSFNAPYLRGAIWKRLREQADGLDLDARDRRRVERAFRQAMAKPRLRALAPPFAHDPRVPPIGTMLRRRHGEREVEVRVTRQGFAWQGRSYTSLSSCDVAGPGWPGSRRSVASPAGHGVRAPPTLRVIVAGAMADPTIEKSLWVELGGSCPGRQVLLGNAHTFTGRILTWCPHKGRAFNISVAEIVSASRAAVLWLHGFLSGSEPAPPREPDATDDSRVESAERLAYRGAYEHWSRSVELYAETGYWNAAPEACEACGRKLLHSWTAATCSDCGGTLEATAWSRLRQS